jgi:hypothetical protein
MKITGDNFDSKRHRCSNCRRQRYSKSMIRLGKMSKNRRDEQYICKDKDKCIKARVRWKQKQIGKPKN